ncbi:MAG: serine hydrolase [Niabella sp.]
MLYVLAVVLLIQACKSNSEPDKEVKAQHEKENTSNKEKISKSDLKAYQIKLSQYFDTMLLNKNFNGGILVAKGGNILYEAYIGYQNPTKHSDTITTATSFHLASTSKPFTGMAVMKLAEEGKIGLEDMLTKYFPDFPYEGVTVKDLLSHRSGLPNYLYFMDDKTKWEPTRMVTNNDVINFLLQYKPPKSYTAGTRFNYCNTNYVLLASIVEKVTGKPFPQYMRETFFDPIGMKNTFVYTPADSGHVIMSYKPSGTLWPDDKYDLTYGDKNVYSTPRDMFLWDSALYQQDFISKAILDSAFVPRSIEKPSIHNYGYGWRMLNLKNGKNVIYHFGKWHGFTPAFARLIDEKVVIIILGNRYNKSMYEAALQAYNLFGDYMQSEPGEEESDTVQPTGPVNENQIKNKKKDTAVKYNAIKKKPAPKNSAKSKTDKKPSAQATPKKKQAKQ